jgi:hypothetical protein
MIGTTPDRFFDSSECLSAVTDLMQGHAQLIVRFGVAIASAEILCPAHKTFFPLTVRTQLNRSRI